MPFLPWLFALVSTAVCLYLWFREVRRIMRVRKSTVESAAGQLISCRNRALDGLHDQELDEVLARSESIYQQGLDLYHDTLDKIWVKLPAKLMGFDPLDREEYLCQLAEQRSGETFEPEGRPIFREKAQSYIGSVRFFKKPDSAVCGDPDPDPDLTGIPV